MWAPATPEPLRPTEMNPYTPFRVALVHVAPAMPVAITMTNNKTAIEILEFTGPPPFVVQRLGLAKRRGANAHAARTFSDCPAWGRHRTKQQVRIGILPRGGMRSQGETVCNCGGEGPAQLIAPARVSGRFLSLSLRDHAQAISVFSNC